MSNAETLRQLHHKHLKNHKQQQQQAIEIIDLLNSLNDNQDIQVSLFGDMLAGTSINHIVAVHAHTAQRSDIPTVNLADTLKVLKAVAEDNELQAAQIDIGQLLSLDKDLVNSLKKASKDWREQQQHAQLINKPQDVVLYGFGRIGRVLTRLLLSQPSTDKGLQLKAIVVRPSSEGDLAKRASLLERDSIHGTFSGAVSIDKDNNGMVINGRFVQVIYANDPSEIDYGAYGINDALVIDNTGKWKDEAGLSKHLQSEGVSKVLLTAPAKGTIKNIVYGVNQQSIGDDNIISAASCTTNAITPTLKVLNDKYGIDNGHVETIHSFTNDQNLIDNYHKADRRGRSAVLNMVITSTGAAKAVGKALPELDGKLTGNAIRVPTPNVSLAILNLNLQQAPQSVDALNGFLQSVANSHQWQAQIGYSDATEAVSTDFVGVQKVGIIDAQATIVTDNHVTIYVWYDNEVGYSTQVLRVAETMAGIQRVQIPSCLKIS